MKNKRLQTPWANISDMMSGLMMVFLFISITYSFQVGKQTEELQARNDKISQIAGTYTDNRSQIYEALNSAFSSKFVEWGATLDKNTLTLRFDNPALLFDPGSKKLTPRFKSILSEFWIEYVEILSIYSKDIREIKIEGHTSSEWSGADITGSYFNNMLLSQERTTSTLEFCYNMTPDSSKKWIRSFVTANGMSFSRPILDIDGLEDTTRSRRVEFTIIVDSNAALDEILGELK
tara:strand:+ start:452 stop:1153 length:702 start_codon:yes stop_codon:yes gene_type:complete